MLTACCKVGQTQAIMNLKTQLRRTFSKRNRVLVALLVVTTIVAVIVMRNRSQLAYTHVPIDTTNPFIVKLQNEEATVQMLVNALGSTNKTTRRQAARAIVALRQHYIEEVAQVVQEGYDKGLNGSSWPTLGSRIWWMPWKRVQTVFGGTAPPEVTVQIRAMNLLAQMRPTDPLILRGAAQLTSFYFDSGFNNALTIISPPATEIIAGGSLSSLPILVQHATTEPRASKTFLQAPATACLSTVLGAMAAAWVKDQSRSNTSLATLSQKLALLHESILTQARHFLLIFQTMYFCGSASAVIRLSIRTPINASVLCRWKSLACNFSPTIRL